MTNVIIAVNHDTDDQPYGSSGVDWVPINLDNDKIIFTGGSDVVKDGEPIPSASELTQAGILLEGTEKIVSKYLLADISANELKEVFNMGNQNKRYVMAFVFDGPTASEPVLEAWDDDDMDSIDNLSLGAGIATSSWLRGVVTTSGLPGTDWAGQRIAGASDGHFLWLNDQNGALSGAQTLYCNLKLIIPASQIQGIAETPILVCKYTTN
jgi:hypothetical protein